MAGWHHGRPVAGEELPAWREVRLYLRAIGNQLRGQLLLAGQPELRQDGLKRNLPAQLRIYGAAGNAEGGDS